MNILGIGRDKSQSQYITDGDTKPEYEMERGQGPDTPPGHTARPGPRQQVVWPPLALLRLVFWLLESSGKIGTLAFVPSNSENIHFLTLLEPKTTENRQLALWLLLIG